MLETEERRVRIGQAVVPVAAVVAVMGGAVHELFIGNGLRFLIMDEGKGFGQVEIDVLVGQDDARSVELGDVVEGAVADDESASMKRRLTVSAQRMNGSSWATCSGVM